MTTVKKPQFTLVSALEGQNTSVVCTLLFPNIFGNRTVDIQASKLDSESMLTVKQKRLTWVLAEEGQTMREVLLPVCLEILIGERTPDVRASTLFSESKWTVKLPWLTWVSAVECK